MGDVTQVFSARAMRHVFRVRPNASNQAWVTLLNPIVSHGYPGQWVLTLDGPVTEPTQPGRTGTPEAREGMARWRG